MGAPAPHVPRLAIQIDPHPLSFPAARSDFRRRHPHTPIPMSFAKIVPSQLDMYAEQGLAYIPLTRAPRLR